MKRIDDNTRDKIISLYLNGKSAIYLATIFDINVKSIYNILKDSKIKYRHGVRKYFPNEKVFENYNKKSCYWAGFIAADGCITKNNIEICLKNEDIGHLEKFIDFIGAKYPINDRKDGTSRVSIGSQKMVKDLYNYFNIYANKTFTLSMPKLPPNMIPHYIRGYFDGDGSIYCRNSLICFDITSGSKRQIDDIKNYFLDIDIECNVYKYKNKYSLRKSGKKSIKILNKLYSDASYDILLNRKKEKFDSYIKEFKCV